jgi:hypothetical protein
VYLFQLGDEITQAIVFELAQEGIRDIRRNLAATGTFADLRRQAPRNGGGQLLGA